MTLKANPLAVRFVRNLIAAFSRWKTDDATKDLYVEKLSKWSLSEEIWARALSQIVGNEADDHLPPLAVVYGYLKSAQAKVILAGGLHWQSFNLKGQRYFRRIKDPCNVPDPPRGATDVSLHIDPDKQELEPGITGHEARAAFAQGFIEAGGDEDQLNAMFRSITTREKAKPESHKSEFTHIAKGGV